MYLPWVYSTISGPEAEAPLGDGRKRPIGGIRAGICAFAQRYQKFSPEKALFQGLRRDYFVRYPQKRLYVNSWGRDKTSDDRSCRRESLRHDFYVWQNRIFLKFEKFRIQKQTRFKTFVLLLQPSMKPLDQETSMEFRISWNQL